MSLYTIENGALGAAVDSKGAELRSLKRLSDGKEYMWRADPAFWGRTSPVLFPFVGGTKEKTYYYRERKYAAAQHGFARDMEFSLSSRTESEIWFELRDTPETRENYPFSFSLRLGYRLEGNTLKLLWEVKNTGDEEMFFSIGGHPAFNCDLNTDGLIFFTGGKAARNVTSGILVTGGNTLSTREKTFALENGYLPLAPSTFDEDALIIENRQADGVCLVDKNKKPVLTVSFDAPLFGVWSPAGKNAPFVCIEPWFGRCDAEDFSQKLEEKAYISSLEPGDEFKKGYTVEIN
ncbi:MAG: aldose 1-epimerase family protein [Clostridia bacterium]|nr:aldose 1-epimerase family protein [Clostridia bacterium]